MTRACGGIDLLKLRSCLEFVDLLFKDVIEFCLIKFETAHSFRLTFRALELNFGIWLLFWKLSHFKKRPRTILHMQAAPPLECFNHRL